LFEKRQAERRVVAPACPLVLCITCPWVPSNKVWLALWPRLCLIVSCQACLHVCFLLFKGVSCKRKSMEGCERHIFHPFADCKNLFPTARTFCVLQEPFANCKNLLPTARTSCQLQEPFANGENLLPTARTFCQLQAPASLDWDQAGVPSQKGWAHPHPNPRPVGLMAGWWSYGAQGVCSLKQTRRACACRSVDPRRRSAAAAILSNIHFNPGNATTLYKAEIKLKFAALLRLRGECCRNRAWKAYSGGAGTDSMHGKVCACVMKG